MRYHFLHIDLQGFLKINYAQHCGPIQFCSVHCTRTTGRQEWVGTEFLLLYCLLNHMPAGLPHPERVLSISHKGPYALREYAVVVRECRKRKSHLVSRYTDNSP